MTGIALRAKAYWGYPPDFMAACRDELTVLPQRIASGQATYVVAETALRVVGFYGLEPAEGTEYELDALFVEPSHIGTGVGRTLMRHALDNAASRGATALIIQADPNAERFYLAAGGIRTGIQESHSIRGRFLPVFRFHHRTCR